MIDPIQTNAAGPIAIPSKVVPAGAAASGGKFMDVLLNSLDEVNKLQTEADQSVQALYSGKTDDMVSVFTAVNKADVAFDLLMEIRNKLIDAYRDIQQIRV